MLYSKIKLAICFCIAFLLVPINKYKKSKLYFLLFYLFQL